MKIKVAEAIGPTLDRLVTKCEGVFWSDNGYFVWKTTDAPDRYSKEAPSYSTDWAQGGPLIEGERVWIAPEIGKEGAGNAWSAVSLTGQVAFGPTALVAAMRCYVASKLGDEVDIPEELHDIRVF